MKHATAYKKALADQRFQLFLARCLGKPFALEEGGQRIKGFFFRGTAYITDTDEADPDEVI